MLGEIAEIEDTLIGIIPVGSHLLERLDQLGGMIEIGNQLRRRLVGDFQEVIQRRALEFALRELAGNHGGLAFQRRSNRQAGAHGRVDFVRNSRHQASKGCELFRFDQKVLGLLQIMQCALGRVPCAAQLALAGLQRRHSTLAFGDLLRGDVDTNDLASRLRSGCQ